MDDERFSERRWWTLPEGQAHGPLWAAWRHLRAVDGFRQSQHLHWIRLYGNKAFQSLNPAMYTKANSENRLKLNLVRAVVDRVHSRISQQRPRPWPVSTGGNYSLRRRSRLLGRYLDAQLRIMRAHALGARIVKDACVVGAGAIKVFEDGHQVRLERALCSELFVDPVDGYYGTPRTLYQMRWMSRDVLAELYPKRRALLANAGERTEATDLPYAADLVRDAKSDQVLTVEAWHLPSGPNAEDGYRVVAVDSGVLEMKPWTHDYFPFVFLQWDDPLLGFWSDSIPAMVSGVQTEINTYLQKIQSSHNLYGHPFMFVANAKRAMANTFSNKIGTFIETGEDKPPEIRVFQTLSPEIYQTLENYWNKGFELVGATSLAGTKVPAGLPESGVGLRTWNDIASVTHLPFAQRYEQLFVDLAYQIIDRARDIAKKKGGNYAVPAARDKYTLASVKWSEVDMERDQYWVGVFPTSNLPAEPAGKLAAVESMANAGIVGGREARLMLDFPDLESETTLDRAVTESIDRAVELMLDEGQRLHPSPYMDLQLAMKRVQAHLLEAECLGAPEERLDLLRAYLDETFELMRKAQVEQMKVSMAAAADNAPAPAAPGAPPAPGPAGAAPTAV